MAAEKVKKKRVGNAALYIGLPWEKRKSLPRDSRGFEPLDGYFLSSKDESDSDSSETDTEELVRQEMMRRREERRVKLEAREKVEGKAAATNEAQVSGSTGEGETVMEMEDGVVDKTITVSSGANHTAASEASSSQHVSREDLYSPQKSILAISPRDHQMKVMPSRLRFSSSPGESASEGAAAADAPKSTERRRKKYRRSVVCKSPRKSTLTKVLTTITVEPEDSNHVGEGAGESTRTLANGVQDTALESAASSKSFMSATDRSFRPTKTSTRMKSSQVQSNFKQKPSARKQVSSIHPIMQVSDSESEDEMLTSLLGNRNQSDVFQGLNQLTHSRSAMATKEKLAPTNRQQTRQKKKRKTEKSDVEASEQLEEDTKKESRRLVRKSVTFVDVPPLSASPGTSGKSGSAKKASTQSEEKQAERSFDVYDFPQLEDDSPPISSPTKKSKVTESHTLSKTASNESLKSSSPRKTSTVKRPRSPKKTATKRKSILKEVSVVVRKEPSPLSISQGQWFIPNDVSSTLTAKTSKTDVSHHTRSRLQHSSEESANSSGNEERRNTRSAKKRQAQSQEQTLPSKSRRKRSSKKSVASADHAGQEEAAVEDDLPPATNDMDAFEGPSRVSGLEDSTGSQKGCSALNDEVEGGAEYSGIAESKRPGRRKRSSRVVLGPKTKRRKKDSSTAKTGEENQFLSDEEEAGVRDGLDITYSAGGRRYRRLRVQPSKSHTPGVRRSKRTRIAPVRTWENEEVEYDMRRRSGAVIRGVLVPMEDSSTTQRKRRRAAKVETESEDEEEFPPVRITDNTGKVLDEKFVVKTLSSHEAINSQGEPAEKWDDVVITRLHSTPSTSNGRILFRSLAEKDRSRAGNYEMFFYVLKGKLLFKINSQEYRLKPQMEIHIPAKTVYSIRNLQRSQAEVFFYTHLVTEGNV